MKASPKKQPTIRSSTLRSKIPADLDDIMPSRVTPLVNPVRFNAQALRSMFEQCNDIFEGKDFNVAITFFKDGDWQAIARRCHGSRTRDEPGADGKLHSMVTTYAEEVWFEKSSPTISETHVTITRNPNGLETRRKRSRK